jgi:uracil-DNA glycosylase
MDTKRLGREEERQARLARLGEPHIAPLTNLVYRIRESSSMEASVPFFDPEDGGIDARALFVLEAPGPRAVKSGFISRDNPDETAKNIAEFLSEAGLAREETVLCNAVPWYIGSGKKIRPAGKADLRAGEPYLRRLVELLPKLMVVVLLGKKAQRLQPIKWLPAHIHVMPCPHPSPLFVNRLPGNRQEMLDVLNTVAARLAHGV